MSSKIKVSLFLRKFNFFKLTNPCKVFGNIWKISFSPKSKISKLVRLLNVSWWIDFNRLSANNKVVNLFKPLKVFECNCSI